MLDNESAACGHVRPLRALRTARSCLWSQNHASKLQLQEEGLHPCIPHGLLVDLHPQTVLCLYPPQGPEGRSFTRYAGPVLSPFHVFCHTPRHAGTELTSAYPLSTSANDTLLVFTLGALFTSAPAQGEGQGGGGGGTTASLTRRSCRGGRFRG